MKMLDNERGGVLLYALMIMIVLAAFVPVILHMTSTRVLTEQRTENKTKADMLAVSTMESLLTYLKHIGDTDVRETYFEAFPGWGEHQIMEPNGNVSSYTFYPTGVSSVDQIAAHVVPGNYYEVTVAVETGTGSLRTQKTVSFELKIPAGSGPATGSPDPDAGADHPLLNPESYFTDTEPPYVDPVDNKPNYMITADSWNEPGAYEAYYNNLLPVSGSEDYIVYSKSELLQRMHDSGTGSDSEVVIKCYCSGGVTLGKSDDADFDNYDVKFIIYLTGGTPEAETTTSFTVINGAEWYMKGMLLVNGDLNVQSGGKVTVDNVFVSGDLIADSSNNSQFIVKGSAGAGSFTGEIDHPPNVQLEQQTYDYLISNTDSWSPVRK